MINDPVIPNALAILHFCRMSQFPCSFRWLSELIFNKNRGPVPPNLEYPSSCAHFCCKSQKPI